ncbi:5-dehydro-4-deoxy-D-glucuronate isomerase [Spirochaeta cellobiosiphila]|uniref:5-dehydro-4-deoxy-D-glucuronate isomerase n=1 Tax=Spirochaeta cellobiosiphila TaxID=504483 RepID=UPI000411E641|nr:5-dehydro-4-deoxy-D-glucuronate isomerase [Spirochaeta cellobiosiphila]
MDIRHPVHPEHGKKMDTTELKRHFQVENIFGEDKVNLTYSHIDRIVFGGVIPKKGKVDFPKEVSKEIAQDYFLAAREMGVINLGGKGTITADGVDYELENLNGLYLPRGTKEISFASADASAPAKYYIASSPAHKEYPVKKITLEDASPSPLGDSEKCNKRTIYKYLHPNVLETCQLSMGFTRMEPGSVWNTYPSHTHERRMEVYLYTEMDPDTLVFHMHGEPSETRHIIMRNDQAVISPSWSIHTGVGTGPYSFIWAMCGENKVFDDMDWVAAEDMA